MRLSAITMVYQGYNTLRRWYHHYGRMVGYENLYIVSHGDDPKHREIAPLANIIGIPRTQLDRFDHHRTIALNGLTRFLEVYFDAVIRTDVDEFIFVDPVEHESLAACLQDSGADVWFSLGFNVFPDPASPPLVEDKLIAEQRSLCVFDRSYCKAVIARNGMFLGHHGARDPKFNSSKRMALPKGLYMAHIRFVSGLDEDGSDSTTEFSRSGKEFVEVLAMAHSKPIVDADSELETCFALLKEKGLGRYRRRRPGIWVVPSMPKRPAFRLPKRFEKAF